MLVNFCFYMGLFQARSGILVLLQNLSLYHLIIPNSVCSLFNFYHLKMIQNTWLERTDLFSSLTFKDK